jgi:hypothetical protein
MRGADVIITAAAFGTAPREISSASIEPGATLLVIDYATSITGELVATLAAHGPLLPRPAHALLAAAACRQAGAGWRGACGCMHDLAEMAGSACPLHRAILERFHQVYDVVFPRLNLSLSSSDHLLLQAFYTSLVSDLTLDPPCYLRVVRLLREVRDGISDVATGRIAQEINETIDLELIDQRISSRAFTWADCRNLITGVVLIIRRMQKPARDASLKAGWDELRTAMEATNVFDALHLVASLKFLLERVNFLRVDAANARYVFCLFFFLVELFPNLIFSSLRLIAPVVRDHGVEYQQGKFKAKVEDGTYTLERVKVIVFFSKLIHYPN